MTGNVQVTFGRSIFGDKDPRLCQSSAKSKLDSILTTPVFRIL